MKTRIVHTKIWQDSWFCSLQQPSRIVFLYLLTCQYNNLCGKFELSDRTLLFDTKVTHAQLEIAKKELQQRVVFYKGWVRILHAGKYNNYVFNTKMEIASEKEKKLIPEEIDTVLDEYDTSIHTSIYTPNNHKSEIIIHKSEKKDESVREENTEAKQVLAWYNEYFGKDLKTTHGFEKNLYFWISQGTSMEDIRKSLETASKDSFWKDKMTPMILFRTKDPQGQDVDRISGFLAKEKQKYKPMLADMLRQKEKI